LTPGLGDSPLYKIAAMRAWQFCITNLDYRLYRFNKRLSVYALGNKTAVETV